MKSSLEEILGTGPSENSLASTVGGDIKLIGYESANTINAILDSDAENQFALSIEKKPDLSKQGVEKIRRFGRIPELLDTGKYETFSPEKTMLVKDFLKGLNLNAKYCGVIANNKKACLEDVITPEDRIVVLPYFQGGSDHITKMAVKEFFRLIKTKIENILGVKVNYRELSLEYLKMKNKWYVNDRILDSLRFTDYVLPTASLNQFKRNLVNIFKEKSAYFEYIIDLYKSLNPWKYEKLNINSNYFTKIDTLEKAYWLGFLLAESSIRIAKNSYRFLLKLESQDIMLLKKFGNIINFDLRRINYYREYSMDGKLLRKFRISFSDKLFCENLIKNGFPKDGKTHNPNLRFPYWVVQGGDKRLVMTMLMGFFDGDGTLGYNNLESLSKYQIHKLNPRIYSISYQFLEDIKNYFEIENDILPKDRGVFRLSIGRELFNQLLNIYEDSLSRKRYYFYL